MDLEVRRLPRGGWGKALAESERGSTWSETGASGARVVVRGYRAARDEKEASAASAAADTLARAERSELGLENAAKELKSALMDLEVLRLALELRRAAERRRGSTRRDWRAGRRARRPADAVAARDEKAAKELKSALMDLEALRLAEG